MTDGATAMSPWDSRAWRLPWGAADVPHALLDILRGCNLKCRACYNQAEARCKPLAEVKAEVDGLLRLRRLQSISIVGGEPLMHPELCDIVRFLRHRGLYVELFTNGLLLDAEVCARLKEAGASVVFIHVDSGQQRQDLPGGNDMEARQRLIQEKSALLAAVGLEAGLAMTAYPDQLQEVAECVRLTLDSADLGYLLVTRCREHAGIQHVGGDIEAGLTATVAGTTCPTPKNMRSHLDMQQLLHAEHALRPFAGIASNRDPHDARWLSYLVGTTSRHSHRLVTRGIRASLFERLFSVLHRRLVGRYPFFVPWRASRFWIQLLLNAVSGGTVAGNLRLACSALRPGNRLHAKRLLFQNPAEVDAAGNVTHCLNCPDAVLHHGKLVPVCIVDLHRSSIASKFPTAEPLNR